ncbi:hypothetical protein LX36DRAFT_297574 [Colletotrichum falcatum]|nr:hypothetical protein LX36DRAFT_297574 [Colletotrichum falcatum]
MWPRVCLFVSALGETVPLHTQYATRNVRGSPAATSRAGIKPDTTLVRGVNNIPRRPRGTESSRLRQTSLHHVFSPRLDTCDPLGAAGEETVAHQEG